MSEPTKNTQQVPLFGKLRQHMGRRRYLLTLSMGISALSTLANIGPLLCVWLIIEVLLVRPWSQASAATAISYGWWAFGLSVAGIALYYLSLTLSHLAAFRVESAIRLDAMTRAMRLPLGFFERHTVGKMRSVIDDNASITHTFVAHQLPDLIGGFVVMLTTLVLLFVADWRMGLLCFIPILVAILAFRMMMGKTYYSAMNQYMQHLEAMNAQAVEYVRGIPVVKVFQQTVYSFRRFHSAIELYCKWATAYTERSRVPMLLYTCAMHSYLLLLVPASIVFIARGEDWRATIVNLMFYVMITPLFSQSMMKLMYMADGQRRAQQALTRVEELFDGFAPLTRQDPKALPAKSPAPAPQPFDICFENVTFRYDKDSQPAVNNLCLTLEQGKRYALVGPSGSGKTTIARLIARFWDVETGRITLGGKDIREFDPDTLLQSMSIVFQHVSLFKTSLRDNILYGKPDATDKELARAIELAQCQDIVDKFPDGLDTVIGTQGVYLSGGEQQRIVLARAFLKDAPVLLLDEATAFADPDNELQIQQALRTLMKGKTVLMIAHRLSSVQDCDKVIVLRHGQVIEQGSHDDLVERKHQYSDMWNTYTRSVNWTLGKEGYNA